MRYCVLFPQAENVHLIKDVGMIAYKLNKLYGYEAQLACYENGSYPYAEKEVKGLKIAFIKRAFNNEILDGINYLRINAKNIDVLQVFHVTLRTIFYAFSFKHFNRRGKIFLKLDCTKQLIENIKSLKGLKLMLFNKFIARVDIMGVEQKSLYNELLKLLPNSKDKIINIPNGFDFNPPGDNFTYNFVDKKNIILNVGRIGSTEKNIETLVKAFSNIEEEVRQGWTLMLVGPVTEEFKIYLQEFFENNPKSSASIILQGAVYDRHQLNEIYKKSKIFCSSSKFESFGIALLEAAAFGDILVSTDTGIARELTVAANGVVVEINNPEQLCKGLSSIMKKSPEELEAMSKKTYDLCRENYNWDKIVKKLYAKINN